MLTIHRAERADRLVRALGALLADPLADPFESEVVAVPSSGIERWLAQQLSNSLGNSGDARGDGVCANVEFLFPAHLAGRALRAVTGVDSKTDPWAPERAVWSLLSIIDAHLDEPWMATVSGHIGGSTGDDVMRTRRFGTARHIADLFDRYSVHRPTMITAWAAGDDVDGDGTPLPTEVAWQAKLWRLLRERLDVPSPAERLALACERIRVEPELVELPARVSLFGLTRVAPSLLQVFGAVAVARDVHLFLLHPSPGLWRRVADGSAPDASARSPLLSTWGRDAREMQIAVSEGLGEHAVVEHADARETTTLLERLQADIRSDSAPPGAPFPDGEDQRLVLDRDDDSIQVHSCHGRARQVEVIRDAILHLLAADPTMEPRDVIVMCPDIETFAPLIHAAFGAVSTIGGTTQGGAGTALRVRLADRSLRQVNPVLGAVAALLELVPTRLTAPQVLDFAGLAPVRRRFRLDDDDISRLEEWVAASGVRWGLHPDNRRPFSLESLDANTWRRGLDRVLLGVAMSEDESRLVADVLPLDDVDSGEIELAGRLAELVDRIDAAVSRLGRRQTVGEWVAAIATSADELVAWAPGDAWQRTELERLLTDVVEEASAVADTGVELGLPEIRAVLADRLRGRPTRANFRTGHLTICTLVPMRSVPHRVICLLGLDDDTFPRHGAPDGDDILVRTPRVGDRDVRTEDRQLLLDALMAAKDHLVVTYAGRDERTNAQRPPSVPIGELLDVIDATARTPTGRARSQVLIEHPLQPFDARNFEPGRLIPTRPWGFDRAALDGARAMMGTRTPPAPFLDAPLPPLDASTIELDDLVRFAQHPAKAFLRRRLSISMVDEDELADAIPIELDALERWGVGDRLLSARLAGAEGTIAAMAEQARGLLPPGEFGERVLAGLDPLIDQIVTTARRETGGEVPGSVDVRLDVGTGRTLSGTVAGVYGTALVSVAFSRVGPKHRLASWIRLLALTVADPTRQFSAVTLGQGKGSKGAVGVGVASVPPLAPADALEHLRTLVDLYERGMREPLPLYCKTSEALARSRDARTEWETGTAPYPKEDREREHVRILGGNVPFARLLEELPRPDESGPGWDPISMSRIERYARRLWSGLLAVEERHGL